MCVSKNDNVNRFANTCSPLQTGAPFVLLGIRFVVRRIMFKCEQYLRIKRFYYYYYYFSGGYLLNFFFTNTLRVTKLLDIFMDVNVFCWKCIWFSVFFCKFEIWSFPFRYYPDVMHLVVTFLIISNKKVFSFKTFPLSLIFVVLFHISSSII